MFSSGLKRRMEWAAAIRELQATEAHAWREVEIDGYDIAVPFERGQHDDQCTRLLLLHANEIDQPQTMKRVARLRQIDGGHHVAIILLLGSPGGMEALAKLQVMTLCGNVIPIIPLSKATELPSCLQGFRRQGLPHDKVEGKAEKGDLLQHCAQGKAFGRMQLNVLEDVTGSLQDLTSKALDPDGQQMLHDLVGSQDGQRIIDFLGEGPRPFFT